MKRKLIRLFTTGSSFRELLQFDIVIVLNCWEKNLMKKIKDANDKEVPRREKKRLWVILCVNKKLGHTI